MSQEKQKCKMSVGGVCKLDKIMFRCSGIGHDLMSCGDAYQYTEGGNQPLTESDIKQIRAHKIHNGKIAACSECWQALNIPEGYCGVCPNCFAQIGGGCQQ
ncbi:MAG: hypothetical protein P8X74_03850 [Reinekea sp.]